MRNATARLRANSGLATVTNLQRWLRVCFVAGAVAAAAIANGCAPEAGILSSNGSPKEIPVHLRGTSGYQKTVRSFAVTVAQARSILKQKQKELRHPASPNPFLVVGDCYVFGLPSKTKIQPLTGYYVNGRSGNIRFLDMDSTVNVEKRSVRAGKLTTDFCCEQDE